MSHPEQTAFFQAVASRNRELVAGARILEIGSYDVNGSIRAIFADCAQYIGVDLMDGPGVDITSYGHQLDHPEGSYDITLSGECFEHDPHWRSTLANMVRMTKPGGLVAFTCASRGRPEHGTRRTGAVHSPGTQAEGLDYYRNLTERDFAELPLGQWFDSWAFWRVSTNFDLYFAGVRGGGPSVAALPAEADIEQIRSIMPLPHRIARLPLRLATALVSDEERYQDLVHPYWQLLLRLRPADYVRSE